MPDRLQPEDRETVARLDIDVGRFADGLVLMRPEGEPVRSEAMDGRHADLADGRRANIIVSCAYVRVIRLRTRAAVAIRGRRSVRREGRREDACQAQRISDRSAVAVV
jgi:hypothetical protein